MHLPLGSERSPGRAVPHWSLAHHCPTGIDTYAPQAAPRGPAGRPGAAVPAPGAAAADPGPGARARPAARPSPGGPLWCAAPSPAGAPHCGIVLSGLSRHLRAIAAVCGLTVSRAAAAQGNDRITSPAGECSVSRLCHGLLRFVSFCFRSRWSPPKLTLL